MMPGGGAGVAEVKHEMILDGRAQRFALQIPWASYAMLRPFVSPAAAAVESGRMVVSRAAHAGPNGYSTQPLVPTILRTLDTRSLPPSLTPRAIHLSSLPYDCFVAYLFVVRLLDGRTVRAFHRFSAIRAFVARMRKELASQGGLVEVRMQKHEWVRRSRRTTMQRRKRGRRRRRRRMSSRA